MGAHHLAAFPDGGLYLMQGRLSPPEDGRFQSFPRSRWQEEIELAARVPLRGIEWIFDAYGEGANPLDTQEGRTDLRRRLAAAGVAVASICADYFMDRPLVRVAVSERDARIAKLDWLISVARELEIGRVVLPFVDASRIAGPEEARQALHALHAALPRAETNGVELHLETDMSPAAFKAFLREIEHPMVKVNYDSGNSGSLGYAPAEEFEAYGSRIGSVHIKDALLVQERYLSERAA